MPKTASKAAKRKAPRNAAGEAAPRAVRVGKAAPASTAAAAKKAAKKKPAAKTPRKKRAAPRSRARGKPALNGVTAVALAALDELKAQDVRALDVRHLTSVTDTMIVAAGRSDRHVRAIADALLERCKAAGYRPLGVEGQDAGEWVLVDLADVIVHVMLPRVREFYNIESLWDMTPRAEAQH